MRRPLLLLPLALLACSPASETEPLAFEPASSTAAPDPSKMGPFAVGVRTETLLDPSHPEPDGSPKPIVVEIWYPATEAARGKPGATYDVHTLLTPEQLAQVKDISLPPLQTSAVRDAAPRKDHGPYPLVVFSHGHGGMRWQSTFYTVLLASHGYVVVAPDHLRDTLADALRGQLAQTYDAYEPRFNDATFLLDTFTDLPATDPLAGMIDASHIGFSGHSFGALTSLHMAAFDDRVKAIVPQAPPSADLAFVGKLTSFKLSTPTLVEAAHDDQTLGWDDHVMPTWNRLNKPRALLDITHGGHFTFSDLCAFDLGAVAKAAGFVDISEVISDGCGPEAPKASVAQPMMNHFAVAFFNAQLRGSTGSWDLLTQAKADAIGQGVATVTVER